MLRRADGFTVVELLVALLVGGVVMTTAVSVLTGAQRRSDDVQRRTEALQQARLGMDASIRQLRAQACLLTSVVPEVPIVSGTSSEVEFYADFSGGTGTPQRRRLRLDAVAGTLTEAVWDDPRSMGSPTRTRVLARDVEAVDGVPFLRYYAFDSSNPPRAVMQLGTPLSNANRPLVARIELNLRALPRGRQDGTRRTTLTDEAYVRLADPDGAAAPVCV